jgi:ribosomal protein L7/L12
MKIKVTYNEAQQIIRNAYDLKSTDEVVIVRKVSNTSPNYKVALEVITEIKKLAYTGDDKIKAVVNFRKLVPCGIAEAKWAIENFDEVVHFIHNFKRIPRFNSAQYGVPTLY